MLSRGKIRQAITSKYIIIIPPNPLLYCYNHWQLDSCTSTIGKTSRQLQQMKSRTKIQLINSFYDVSLELWKYRKCYEQFILCLFVNRSDVYIILLFCYILIFKQLNQIIYNIQLSFNL